MDNLVLLHGKLNGCSSVLSVIRGSFQGSLISVINAFMNVWPPCLQTAWREDSKYES